MSDYTKGPWCDVWDGLYWRTVGNNRDFFAANPRTVQVARGYDRLEPSRKERILQAADNFIAAVTV
jgi:deoxyribodipyrimidine photolyase-related protein